MLSWWDLPSLAGAALALGCGLWAFAAEQSIMGVSAIIVAAGGVLVPLVRIVFEQAGLSAKLTDTLHRLDDMQRRLDERGKEIERLDQANRDLLSAVPIARENNEMLRRFFAERGSKAGG